MEPTAQGQTEKSFSYVIRAPSIDGTDGINVDVKIDTCWVFRDLEESDKKQACLPETASSLDLDTGLLREQLESSEQKLLAAVDKHVISESGLRHRVQELELSEKRLLLKVEQLSACVAQERSATLHVQEQLQSLKGTLVSQVREAESAVRRQRRLQERLRRKDEALARQAAALKRCGRVQRQQLGLVREQERVLRVQVQRLERDVRRLGHAAGLLLAQLHTADSSPDAGSSGSQLLTSPLGDPEVVELSALRARAELAEREREKAMCRLREHSATERQLREQLEELRCCVYGLTLSEIGLHSQVEELAHQNRRLRAQMGHGSPGALGCAQSDSLPPLRAEVLDPGRSHDCHGDACGLQGLAGQLSEEPPSCVGEGPDPHMMVSARTIAKLQRDLPGSEHRQGALVQPHLDPQALRPLCSCPLGSGVAEPLCSLDLAGVAENLQGDGAQEPLLLLPTSTLQLWGPAGDPELLLSPLLHECPLHELQSQDEVDSTPSPAPAALAHLGCHCNLARSHDTSLRRESSLISNGPFLPKGTKELRDTRQGRSGPPVTSAEKWGVMGTLGGIKSELDDRCLLLLQGTEKLSLGTEVHTPEGIQEGDRDAGTQAVAPFPWLHSECLILPLCGTASMSQEGPDSLSRRGNVGGHVWEHLVNLSQEKEDKATDFRAYGTQEWRTNGRQLSAGKGKEVWRCRQGKLDHQPCFGDTELLQKESSADEEQEEMQVQVASDLASVGPEQPEFKTHVGQEQCMLIDDQDWLQVSSLVSAGTSSEGPCSSQAPITGQDRYALQTDTLEKEVEACFQQLNNLKLVCGDPQQMSALMAESHSATQRWQRQDIEESMCLQQVLASQDPITKPNRNSEGVGLDKNVVLHNGEVLPGAALSGDKVNRGPAELGGSQLPTTWCTLNKAGSRFHQLSANMKKERSQVLLDNARLEGDQEGCHHEGCPCEKEHAREAATALRLEQANRTLQGQLVYLKHELDQCLQAVSDLEECNRKNYCKISQLEEENEKLKGDLGQLHKAMSESVRKAGSRMKNVILENTELRALISELGVSYKGLIKDTVLGIEDMVWALQGENKHLVGRVQGLEREVLQMSRDPREGKWSSQGNSDMVENKGHAEDKEVQVTMFSRQLSTRACGPSWAEKSDMTGSPFLDLEDSRCRADASTASSVHAVTAEPQEAHTDGAGGDRAWLQREQKTPWCSVQQGQPQRSRSLSPQLQNSKAAASEEDTKVRIQQLHHQVRTLQCQLRDQGWALRELQVARDEAVSLQDKLKGKLEGLWEQQREVRLETSPLKAKLASLVHKCQERNRLIEHLLQELPRHEPRNHLLSELAQNMLEDVALAEYSATFLTPGAPETFCHLDVSSKETSARGGGAQEDLFNSETDSVLQSLWGAEFWSLPGAEWALQTAPPGYPKERRQHHQADHTGKDECLFQTTNGAEVAL
ncbi:uncharacterized protein C4orf50 homolog [Apodemus sylvaticus]|uniref:uncharacterized protein C4orf50 homolog n=1 Tax=Apodemus sylvaticus TaxID=10129 RepID=UPI0022423327|nr:uncharacterized protein C4orf50 homolog [Apodemus sylvaticus]